MSKNVDERVVQMSFDNSGFEKNVKSTIDSLEKLDKSTEKLSQNISKSDLSPLAKGADEVKVKWSIMQSVVDAVGQRIGNKLVDIGSQVLKLINPFDDLARVASRAFSIIENKGWSRAANIENAKFKLQGLKITWDSVFKQIDAAVAGTAYGLDAAASAAAQLSASGVKAGANIRDEFGGAYKKVDDLERALGAISGMAAVTGDSYEHMTDIFTSAAGKGKVTADTFNRISAQGTNAAAALAKSMGTTEAAVRDMASKGQISFQQFADAMYETFYENAKDSNKTYDGALANLQAALGKIGEKFAGPLRKNMVVPFNQLRVAINAVKTNLEPLWTFFDKTLQVAKNFISSIIGYNSEFQGAFDASALSELEGNLTEKFSFIKDICEGLINIFKAVMTVIFPVAHALKDLIPGNLLSNIPELAKQFKEWTATLTPSAETLTTIRKVVYALGIVFKSLLSIVGQLISPFFSINASGTSLVGTLGKILYTVILVVAAFTQWVAESGVVTTAIKALGSAVEFVAGIMAVGFLGAVDAITKVFNTIKALITGEMSLKEFYDIGKNVIFGFINGIIDTASSIITKIVNIFKNVVDAVRNFLGIHSPSVLFYGIGQYSMLGYSNGVTDSFKNIVMPIIQEVFQRMVDKLQSSGADMVIDLLKSLGSGIKDFVTNLNSGKVATLIFAVSVIALLGVLKKVATAAINTIDAFAGVAKTISGVGSSVSGFVDSLTYGVKNFTGQLDAEKKSTINDVANAILKFAGAITIVTACLIALSFVPYDNIKQGGIALLAIVGALSAVAILMTVIAKAFSKFSTTMGKGAKSLAGKVFNDATAKMVKLGAALLLMAGAVAILVKAFNSLDTSGMSFKDIVAKLGVMAIMMVELGAVAIVMSKAAPSLTKGSLFLLIFAGSVTLLAKAFNKMPDLTDGIQQLGILGLSLMLVGSILSKGVTSFGKSIATLAVAALAATAAIAIVAGTIKFLNTYVPMESLAVGIVKIAILGTFVLALALGLQAISRLYKDGAKLVKMGGTLLAISACVGLLGVIAAKIGAVPSEQLWNGVGAISALMAMVAVMMAASALTAKAKPLKFAASLVLITGCIAIMAGLSALVGLVKSDQLWKGVGAFAVLTTMVAGLMIASKFTEKANVKAITTSLIGLFAIVSLMIVMSLVKDWDSIRNSIIAIGSIMLALAVTLAIIGKGTATISGKSIAAMAIAILGIAEVGVILYHLAQQDWKSILSAGAAISATLFMFTNLLTSISSRTGIKVKKIGTVLLASLALVPIGAVIAGLSFFDWKGMLGGAAAMFLVLTSFTKILKTISASSGLRVDKIKNMLFATLAVFPIGVALAGLSFFNWAGMIGAGIGLAAALVGLSTALSIISAAKFSIDKVHGFVIASLTMIPVGMAIAIIASTSGQYLDSFISAGAALGIAINALALAMKIMTGSTVSIGNIANFVLASLAFIPAAVAISMIAEFSWDGIAASVVGLAACVFTLIAALNLMTGARINIAQLAAFVIGSAALIPIGIALSQIAEFDWASILASGSAIGEVALALSIALMIVSNAGAKLVLGAASLLIASLSLLPAAYALSMIAGYDWQNILAAAGAIAGVTAILTACMALAGALGPVVLIGAAALIVGAGAMVVMSYALKIFMPSLLQLVAIAPMLSTLGQGLLDLTPGLLAFSAACIVLGLASVGLIVGGMFLPTFAAGLMALSMVGDLSNVAVSIIKLAAGCIVLGTAAPGIILAAAGLTLLAGAFRVLTTALMGLNVTFTLVLSNIQLQFTKFSTVMTKTAGVIGVNVGAGMIKGIQDSSPNVVRSGITMMSNFLTGIRNKMGIHSPSKVMQALGKFCGVGFDEGSTDSQVWSGIKQKWSKLLDTNVMGPVRTITGKIKTWFAGMKTSVGGMGDAITGAVDKLNDVKETGFDLEEWMNGFIDTEEILDDVTEGVSSAMDDLTGSMDSAGGSGKKTQSVFEKLSETIAGQIDLFSEFSAKTELTADKLLANMKSQIDGVTNWANMMNTLGERGVDKGLLAKLAEMGPQGYEYVNAFVNMTEEQLAQANQYYQQALVLPDSAAATALGQAGKIGENVGVGLIKGLEKEQSAANDAANEAGQQFVGNVAEGAETQSPSRATMRTGEYVMAGLKIGMALKLVAVTTAAKDMAKSIVKVFEDTLTVEKFRIYGGYIGEGLSEGINSSLDKVKSAAQLMISVAEEATTKAARIASPSKLFRSIGKWIPAGLAVGIERNSSLIETASEGMVNKATSAMSDVISSIADTLNSDMDLNPTITPVLDMSNIQNGVDSMGDLFSSGISVSAVKANKASVGRTIGSESQNGSSEGNVYYTFNQTNNSPKALSRVEIYRQTRNQLSQLKGVTL